jgi:transcriptional regulator with XRE-family HTH domain
MPPHTESPWIPDTQTFATRIWAVRMEMGLNRKDFGALVGLSASSIGKWESGTTPQNKDDVARQIAAETGCDPVWLALGYAVDDLATWAGRPAQIPTFLIPTLRDIRPLAHACHAA